MVPWGGLDLLFGSRQVPCGPKCPPGDLWRILVLILELIWIPKSINFGVDFGCVFGMFLLSGVRMVLAMFWETF